MIEDAFDPDQLAGDDPSLALQGHVGGQQAIHRVIETRVITDPKTGFQCMERILADQWENLYIVHSVTLRQDGGEPLQVDAIKWCSDTVIEAFGGFNDSLIDSAREHGFEAIRAKVQEAHDQSKQAGDLVSHLMATAEEATKPQSQPAPAISGPSSS